MLELVWKWDLLSDVGLLLLLAGTFWKDRLLNRQVRSHVAELLCVVLKERRSWEHHFCIDDVIFHCNIRDIDCLNLESTIFININVRNIRFTFFTLFEILLFSLLDAQSCIWSSSVTNCLLFASLLVEPTVIKLAIKFIELILDCQELEPPWADWIVVIPLNNFSGNVVSTFGIDEEIKVSAHVIVLNLEHRLIGGLKLIVSTLWHRLVRAFELLEQGHSLVYSVLQLQIVDQYELVLIRNPALACNCLQKVVVSLPKCSVQDLALA